MKKALIFGLFVLGLAGCETQPMTPEQARALQQFGDAASGFSQQLNQQQQPSQGMPKTCMTNQVGNGLYSVDCR